MVRNTKNSPSRPIPRDSIHEHKTPTCWRDNRLQPTPPQQVHRNRLHTQQPTARNLRRSPKRRNNSHHPPPAWHTSLLTPTPKSLIPTTRKCRSLTRQSLFEQWRYLRSVLLSWIQAMPLSMIFLKLSASATRVLKPFPSSRILNAIDILLFDAICQFIGFYLLFFQKFIIFAEII